VRLRNACSNAPMTSAMRPGSASSDISLRRTHPPCAHFSGNWDRRRSRVLLSSTIHSNGDGDKSTVPGQ
jgi:hypothetical protein